MILYPPGSGLSLSIHFLEAAGRLSCRMIMTFALDRPYLDLNVKLEEVSHLITNPLGQAVFSADLKK